MSRDPIDILGIGKRSKNKKQIRNELSRKQVIYTKVIVLGKNPSLGLRISLARNGFWIEKHKGIWYAIEKPWL